MRKTTRLFILSQVFIGMVSAQNIGLKDFAQTDVLISISLMVLVVAYFLKKKSGVGRITRRDMRVKKPELTSISSENKEEDYNCDVCGEELDSEDEKIIHEQALH